MALRFSKLRRRPVLWSIQPLAMVHGKHIPLCSSIHCVGWNPSDRLLPISRRCRDRLRSVHAQPSEVRASEHTADSGEGERSFRREAERRSGLKPNTIGA